MKRVLPFFLLCVFLFASCAKDDLDGFDSHIKMAADFKVDPITGDTFYRFYMPSAFTPNGDGINDLYYVVGTGFVYDSYNLKIISRENNLLFESSDPWRGWDGRAIGANESCASQLFTVEVSVDDTSHEHHHYVYEAMLFR